MALSGSAAAVQAVPAPESQPMLAQASSAGTVSVSASAATQSAAVAMWTRSARLAAKPLAMPAFTGSAANSAAPAAEATKAGAVGSSSSGAADASANAAARQQFPAEWSTASSAQRADSVSEAQPDAQADAQPDAQAAPQAPVPFGTAAVFTGYHVNAHTEMWTNYPYKDIGRLFFTTPSGGASCTASVISPHNVIVTAAHCVYDVSLHRFYSNWVFVPAYRNGAAPFGTFGARGATVLTAWTTSGSIATDVAVLSLGNNSAGHPVTFYTGWLGRSWNFGSTQSHFTFGYPSNIQSAQFSQACAAESFSGGTDVLGMGCNMTFGSSGGPWIRVFQPDEVGALNFVNSVVSRGVAGSNTFFGARFTSNNIVPICAPPPTGQGC
jgi:V8-like Glu-specific endopeptidase